MPAAALLLSACTTPASTGQQASPPPASQIHGAVAATSLQPEMPTPRVSGRVSAGARTPPPVASYSAAAAPAMPPQSGPAGQGDISLNFAATDINTVIDQILGTILHVNYTVDPTVQGTVSLHTSVPLARPQLIPTLQALLAQVNAVLVEQNGIYRVMPADQAANTPNLASSDSLGGSVVIPLHYTEAASVASMLQPYINATARIVAAPNQNALIVEGSPGSRQALVDLIQAFDVDQLAGQSYELFPVTSGDAKDFGSAFSTALGKSSDPSQPGPINVVPLERINAVLVIARSPELLADAQRIYSVINRQERNTLRSWHVYYLQNGRANDAAYVLQQAFTPDNVTAVPTPAAAGQLSSAFANQPTSSGSSSTNSGGTTGTNVTGTQNGTAAGSTSQNPAADQSAAAGASALLGPLSAGGTGTSTDSLRILTDLAHNSLLIYATADEDDRINAMLAQIDVTPVEVRIDATIAEVDLDSALRYGTQFYFKSGGINAVLSQGTTAALETQFPGFVLSGHGSDAAPLAISMLQSVTKVNVLSSPELMVLDGQSASLQVGDQVPYLTQSSQSTLTAGSPVINSIDYRETGVILQITPHVSGNGLVTMDVSQEVSAVAPATTNTQIDSPTFTDRSVTSRISIQDGETVGLAGLISESDSRGNSGIPYIKNVPLLGALFSTQDNARTRKELLVLITPHVIRTQSDAAALTADLRAQLPYAAAVPSTLAAEPFPESADPDAKLRARIQP